MADEQVVRKWLTPMERRELKIYDTEDERDAAYAVLRSIMMGRCYACGWFLSLNRDKGCVPFDCSYRPSEGTSDHQRWLKNAKKMEKVREAVVKEDYEL